MSLQSDEKLEILNDVLPEVERFTAKARAFREATTNSETPYFVKVRSWRALQRATTDLRDSLAHLTRVQRRNQTI